MNALIRTILAGGAAALLFSHCGGIADIKASGHDAGGDALPQPGDAAVLDTGMCEGTVTAGEVPSEHRPTATACTRTPNATLPDGGTPGACNTEADCAASYLRCAEHQCGYDACLVDGDCAPGTVCVCSAGNGGGLRSPGNVCVPATCAVDSDCGAGNVCEPSRGYCGSIQGFYCTSSKDTCVVPAKDCSCGGNTCVYTPTVGHFVCASGVCNG
jgi:hypothetical protein